MRLTLLLVALGLAAWGIGGYLAFGHSRDATAVRVTAGTVSRLDPGPYHAWIRARPDGSPGFDFFTSSTVPLVVGQAVVVRYDPVDPRHTATIDDDSADRVAVWFAVIGLALIIGGVVAPRLVARFPGLLQSPIR